MGVAGICCLLTVIRSSSAKNGATDWGGEGRRIVLSWAQPGLTVGLEYIQLTIFVTKKYLTHLFFRHLQEPKIVQYVGLFS